MTANPPAVTGDADLTARLAAAIGGCSWPDGGHDGFPSRKVADMIAAALLPLVTAEVAAAEVRALREAGHDVVQSVVTTAHVAICEAARRSDKTAAHIALDEVEKWLNARADRIAEPLPVSPEGVRRG